MRCYLAALIAFSTFVLSAGAEVSNWSLRVWQADDGLPNNNVTGLVQTPDGYLWVATPSGLARFDGVRFEEFSTGSFAQRHQSQRIRTLLGTSHGLCMGIDPGDVISLSHGAAEVFTNNLPTPT